MRREEAIRLLSDLKPMLVQRYGVRRLGFFGSTARNEAGEGSDLDVVIDMPAISLWSMVGLREELEERLQVAVDVVRYRESLNPRLRRRIDAEAIYV